jgi:anti-anti-sigma regulatory factor
MSLSRPRLAHPLAATITLDGDDVRIALDGELDGGTSRLVGAIGLAAPLEPGSRITIDLAGLTFLDLRGVRTITRLVRRCAEAGCRPRLIPPGRRCPAIIREILSELSTARGARIAAAPVTPGRA